MKVLEITCEPILYGGQEAFIFNFLENLHDDDISVDVLTLHYCTNDKYKQIAFDRGANIFELNLDFRPGKSRRHIRNPLRRFLNEHKYDVVHIHSGSVSALAYSAEVAKKEGVPCVIVHSHSTGVNSIRHKLVQTLFSWKLKNNVSIFCACSVEAGSMKFPKSVQEEIIILKNGIKIDKYKYDPEIREKIRNKLSIPENAYLVGQIGRYTFEKNQVFISEIGEKIISKNKNIYFLFIGDGELRKDIEEKLEGMNNFIFLDSCEDVWKYYSAIDLLVLPSLYEGIPLVSIEAQANGLPILASKGVSAEIEINNNVKRISLGDKDIWQRIIENHELKRVNSAEKIINEGWDIESVVKRIVAIYRNSGYRSK